MFVCAYFLRRNFGVKDGSANAWSFDMMFAFSALCIYFVVSLLHIHDEGLVYELADSNPHALSTF